METIKVIKKIIFKVLFRIFNILKSVFNITVNIVVMVEDIIKKYLKYIDENTKLGKKIAEDRENFEKDKFRMSSLKLLMKYDFGLPGLREFIRLFVPYFFIALLIVGSAYILAFILKALWSAFEWILVIGLIIFFISDYIGEKQRDTYSQMQNFTQVEWERLAYHVVIPATKLPMEVLLSYSTIISEGAYHFSLDCEMMNESEITALRHNIERRLTRYYGMNLADIRRCKMVEVTGFSILIRPVAQ